MTVVWVIIGIVLLLVTWALVSAYSGKTEVKIDPMAQAPMQSFEPEERELPKAKHWSESTTAGVSKNFGKGGTPTGVSKDIGGAAKSVDDDMERLKKAKPFERRLTADGMRPDEV
jgi:hypothetical protein